MRTGAVHDLVERARKDIPVSNLAAVKARWKSDREMIADSAAEIDAMVEDPAGAGDEFGGDGFGDDGFDEEWDELGLGTSKRMSEVEIERTKKVRRLHFILHLRSPVIACIDSASRSLRDTPTQTCGARRSKRPTKTII